MPLSKKKEKVDVTQGKGIELLSQVALTEDAQFEEVRRKRTGVKPRVPDVTEEESSESEAESWGNDEDDSNNEQDSSGKDSDQEKDSDDDKTQSDNENKSDSEHETDENESDSKSNQEENEEEMGDDEEEEEEEFVKTPSNNFDNEDETKITDKAKGDEDEEMHYTTSQLYDDVDIRLNEPVDTDKGFVQEEGTDAATTNVQQGNENPKILQVIEDAHVTLFAIPQKAKVPVTSTSHSSDLASKFLNFLDIPHTDAEIVSPMDVIMKDEFMNFLLTSLTARITEQFNNQLPQILPKKVSNFPPSPPPSSVIQKMVKRSLEDVYLAKESSQPQSSYEAVATLLEFELKKILIDKMDKSESYLAAPKHKEGYEGLKKSFDLDKTIFSTYEEPEFEVADSDMPQDQEEKPGNDDEEPKEKIASKRPAFRLLKGTRSNYAELEYDFKESYNALLEKLDWENPKGDDYPFDLTKPLPLVVNGNR
nr:hypothetical protein [Tanacetum cinerariifolium]